MAGFRPFAAIRAACSIRHNGLNPAVSRDSDQRLLPDNDPLPCTKVDVVTPGANVRICPEFTQNRVRNAILNNVFVRTRSARDWERSASSSQPSQ